MIVIIIQLIIAVDKKNDVKKDKSEENILFLAAQINFTSCSRANSIFTSNIQISHVAPHESFTLTRFPVRAPCKFCSTKRTKV